MHIIEPTATAPVLQDTHISITTLSGEVTDHVFLVFATISFLLCLRPDKLGC